jgi:hypothetical protein
MEPLSLIPRDLEIAPVWQIYILMYFRSKYYRIAGIHFFLLKIATVVF